MNLVIWLKNTLRNLMRKGVVGRLMSKLRKNPVPKTVHIVSATRHTEKTFWRQSALGRSLHPWLTQAGVSVQIYYENKRGLPSVYNESLQTPAKADVLLFLHDDIWLDDPDWLPKVLLATAHYDVVGVAGNTRISNNQPSWIHEKIEHGKFLLDPGYCSGIVAHGQLPRGQPNIYGPTPASCKLLDGVFFAVRAQYALESNVHFDERFTFDFYDMDFCRTARRCGLSLGTWPIGITHQSVGVFGSPRWQVAYASYLNKWGS